MDIKRFVAVAIMWLVASTLLFGAVTSPVLALEDADEWDQQIDANGTIVLEEGTLTINGSNNPLPGQPTQNTVTGVSTDSSIGETVTFNWSYNTTDGAYFDKPQVLWNDVWYNLVEGNSQSGSGTQTGYIAAGGLFGFRILSTDSCCGVGTLTITNTSWVVGWCQGYQRRDKNW